MCVYLYMYVYMYICTYMYVYIYIFFICIVSIRTSMYTYGVYKEFHTHVRARLGRFLYMWTYKDIYIQVVGSTLLLCYGKKYIYTSTCRFSHREGTSISIYLPRIRDKRTAGNTVMSERRRFFIIIIFHFYYF